MKNPSLALDITAFIKRRREQEIAEYGHELTDGEREVMEVQEEQEQLDSAMREALDAFTFLLPRRYKNSSFATFKGTKNPAIHEALIRPLKSGQSGILYGDTGVGKTHLGIAAVRYQIEQGKSASYVIAFDYLQEIRALPYGVSSKTVEGKYASPSFLVIDELDKIVGSQTDYAFLYSLINRRYSDEKETLVISNLPTPEEHINMLGAPVYSRLTAMQNPIHIKGDDYRMRGKA